MRISIPYRPIAVALGLVLATCSSVAFSQEEAVAEAVAEAVVEETSTATKDDKPQLRPLTVTAGLVDETNLTGTLIDSTAIQIKTAFGEASIPLSEVAGIRFPAAEDTSTTVVMLNGDSITGATDLKFVNIETVWGSAKINGQNVATMLFVPGLTWQSSKSIGGTRWNLIEATAKVETPTSPLQRTPGQVQPASGIGQPIQQQGRVIFGQ
ncbi:MAG: hypothetical protein R3C53_08140 [Pirellulaceae bacterium]